MAMSPRVLVTLVLAFLCSCSGPESSSSPGGAASEASADGRAGEQTASPSATADGGSAASGDAPAGGLNDRFLDPELDVQSFVDLFEGESREIAVERDALAGSVQLAPGESMADIGAGTGLFLAAFHEAVGPDGEVWAVDIAPGFIEHITRRIDEEGLSTVRPHLGGTDSAGLPPASVDAIFVCDTYHHFERPDAMLASLHEALRPGGRLVIVDFERIPGVSRDWVLGHVRAGKETVVAEVVAAGFRFVDEVDIDGLTENYVVRFRRPR